jgi:hypothetical protein
MVSVPSAGLVAARTPIVQSMAGRLVPMGVMMCCFGADSGRGKRRQPNGKPPAGDGRGEHALTYSDREARSNQPRSNGCPLIFGDSPRGQWWPARSVLADDDGA